MSRRVVVFGSGGMLGRVLAETFERAGDVVVRAGGHSACDIADPDAVRAVLEAHRPDVVLNAAAWTDVDGAESAFEEALRTNGRGPGVLAEACRDRHARLVHYSTDYVFAGVPGRPIPVDAPIDPVNAYGRSKAAGEAAVRERLPEALILRTAWLHDAGGRCFPGTIAGLARSRERLEVVDDQRGRPTSCRTLAELTRRLLAVDAAGTFHACDDGEATWYDLAREVVAGLGLAMRCEVVPCGSERYPRPAVRPAWSVLDLSRTLDAVGPITDWRVALGRELERMMNPPPEVAGANQGANR